MEKYHSNVYLCVAKRKLDKSFDEHRLSLGDTKKNVRASFAYTNRLFLLSI